MEADMQCSNAIQNMERRLRTACHSVDAKLEQVLKVIFSQLLLVSQIYDKTNKEVVSD